MSNNDTIKRLGIQKEFRTWLKKLESKIVVGDMVRIKKLSKSNIYVHGMKRLEGKTVEVLRIDESPLHGEVISVKEPILDSYWSLHRSDVEKVRK
jgi:hypothetical protein